ncbi:hypothetical protein GCM10010433_62600 [Streptomyces pulveraceus]|uniref:RICIN domain-containing protein n=1 Tax=Streptomyces pulveraceus TaxID=68258 RepID=A0ABW1GWW7_9ACTN
MTSRAARFVGAVLAAAALSLTAAGTSSAVGPDHTPRVSAPSLSGADFYTYSLRNQSTDRCIDDSYGDGLHGVGCNGKPYQKFDFYYQYGNIWVLQNQSTGRCIDDSYGDGLHGVECNGEPYQQWEITNYSDGTSMFRNVSTNRCMDDSFGDGLHAVECRYNNYQSFYIQ